MKLRVNYAIDAAMLVAFAACGVTGLLKLPELNVPMGDAAYVITTAIHDWSGVATFVLIAVHAILHAKWWHNATKTIFNPKRSGETPAVKPADKLTEKVTGAGSGKRAKNAGKAKVAAALAVFVILIPLGAFAYGRGASNVTIPQGITYPALTLKDGTYTGTATGYREGLTVAVTVKGGKIASVDIVSDNETPRWFNRVIDVIPARIVDAQSTKVDSVSGATYSSNGIRSAVEAALKAAVK